MNHLAHLLRTFSCVLLCLSFAGAQEHSRVQVNDIRDFPPDFHDYFRQAIPEDLAPMGQPALAGRSADFGNGPVSLFVVDVVVNNTDPNLKNTNTSGDSEPSIAVNP